MPKWESLLFTKSSTLEYKLSVLRVKVYPATIIILYILPLIPIWYFDYLPIQDYPRHLAGIKVLRDSNDGFLRENLSVEFFKGVSPIPNIAFELFATKICFFCDINTTGKIFISAFVLLYILSIYLLSREEKMNYADALLMSLPLVYSTYLYTGFLNFIFSIPIFLLAIWSYLCAKREKRYFIVLGIVSILLYVSHLFAFISFLFFLFIDLVMSRGGLWRRFTILTAVSISLPLCFAINYMLLNTRSPIYYHQAGISYKVSMFMFPFLYFSFLSGIAMFFCYIYALLLFFYASSSINRIFLAATISYFLLYLILPFEGVEGTAIDLRAIAFGMAVLPFSVTLGESKYKWGAFALIGLLVLTNTAVTWSFCSRFQKEISPGLSCLREITDKSRLLPIAVEKNGLFSSSYNLGEPYQHAWGYASLDKDFMTPYFSSKVHHILKYKRELYSPPGGWYLMEDKGPSSPWRGVGKHYDYIAIFGEDQSIEDRIGQIGEKVCKGGIVALYRVNKNDRIPISQNLQPFVIQEINEIPKSQ